MNTFLKALGVTSFFFTMVAGVVFLANFRLNLNHDAYYESPATQTPAPSLTTTRFWHNLNRWDAGWYNTIVTRGYQADNATFFPLYPLTLKVFMPLFSPASAFASAALIVAVITVLAIVLLMLALAKHDQVNDPFFAILLGLFFPTAFFLAAPYSEGLFIALALGFVLALKKQRIGLAFGLGVLLGLTRVTGLALVLYPLWLAWQAKTNQQPWRHFLIVALGPIIGAGLFGLYEYLHLHNALAFITSQNNWGRTTSLNPIKIAANYAKDWRDYMSLSFFHPRFIGWSLNLVSAILGIGLVIWQWFSRREYAVITAAVIALPLLSGTTHSFPRLLLPAIPFVALSIQAKLKNPTARTMIMIISVAGWTFLLTLFTRGYWVA